MQSIESVACALLQGESVSSFATSGGTATGAGNGTGSTAGLHIQQETTCDGCIGADTRVAVKSGTAYPFNALGQLLGELTPGAAIETGCTGAVIGASLLLASAHPQSLLAGSIAKTHSLQCGMLINVMPLSCAAVQARATC